MMLNAWLWSRLWHIFGYCPPQDNNKTLEAQLCELTKSTPSPTCPPTSPTAVFVNIKRAYIDNSIIRKGMCVYLCASCLLDSRRLLNYEWWKEELVPLAGCLAWALVELAQKWNEISLNILCYCCGCCCLYCVYFVHICAISVRLDVSGNNNRNETLIKLCQILLYDDLNSANAWVKPTMSSV